MNQINALSEPSTFGTQFDYAVWTPNSRVTLCNVVWDNTYRDVVYFGNEEALNAYLDQNWANVQTDIRSLTYVKPDHPIVLNLPFNVVNKFNYLRVTNQAQPVPGTDEYMYFYYFINHVEYVAPNTTRLIVQLDVWQTYGRRVSFGRCFIERGHVGIANSLASEDGGRYYLTTPEGFDLGNEYGIYKDYTATIATITNYGILVTSTTDLFADPGTVDAPHLSSATGSGLDSLPNGCGIYYFESRDQWFTFLKSVSAAPWVTQGIMSVQVIPTLDIVAMGNNFAFKNADGSIKGYAFGGNDVIPILKNHPEINVPLFRYDITEMQSDRYKQLAKFRVYPYAFYELTTWSGNPLIIKPEAIPTDDLTVIVTAQIAPPAPRIMAYVKNYNVPHGHPLTERGEYLDMATGIYNFPTFGTVNNSFFSYLASNKNSIAYQHTSADWSQQKALAGAQADYTVATGAISAMGQQTGVSNWQRSQMAGISNQQTVGNAIGSSVGSLNLDPVHDIAGIAGNGINAAVNINATNQGTAVGNAAANASTGISQGQAGLARDTNYSMAQFAAKGDYANAIAGINAKVQDAKMIQPTTSGQIGGDASLLVINGWEVVLRLKMIHAGARNMIGEYWLRYGYAVNLWYKPPFDLACMDHFTYWKMKETYITAGGVPEQFKQTIRGIFEKGVTVWKNASDMGTFDPANNLPLNGISLGL